MKTDAISRKFLDYFRGQGHAVVPSDSLIPSGDPSLLFTSAGMVQFKKHFLGQARLDFRRAASCQKCLRTSDIERVGLTERHLTFFEMLGNFSFGDYFKKDAIAWGWEFLTREMGLDPDRLYASVYKEDDEAVALWKKHLPESRIVRLGEDSNFWNMGPTGPCGPCSEILVDRGERHSQGHDCPGPGCDCDRYLEVWNLVFTQFDRAADGKLNPLPQKNIDTGMGLERLSLVANDLNSAFETDRFQSIIREAARLIGKDPLPAKNARIISDHLRASTFLISDGVLPSNEGRGYILRRLLRRALRQGWTLGKKEPFLNRLVSVVARDMASHYPELAEREKNIASIVHNEERNALETIESGTQRLRQELEARPSKTPGEIRMKGETVFNIYETYGLDKEIQSEIFQDWGSKLVFDEKEYERAKEKAAEIARKGWKGSGEREVTLYAELHKKTGDSVFKGYEALELESKVTGLLKATPSGHVPAEELAEGEEGDIVLAETPFYAESGGQVGDRGALTATGAAAEVLDTQKPVDGLIVQRVKVKQGRLKVGLPVSARVDAELRRHTMRHHTATHLLHAALRQVLGAHVTQAGSLVTPEKLRFDFTYPQALARGQISEVEKIVNRAVLKNIRRNRSEQSLEEARKQGALAFFGDKYGAKVFVVGYGDASTEVCGGTHCEATGDIGLFKIVSESSVGSGIRRIEAVAGEKALDHLQNEERILETVAEKLRSSTAEIPEKIERVFQRQSELEKELSALKRKGAASEAGDLLGRAKPLDGGLKALAERVAAMDSAALRETADHLREKLGGGVVLLATDDGEKVSFVATVTPDALARGYHAGRIAKEFAAKIQGSGGGRESFAQGGGKSSPALQEALAAFPDLLKDLLQSTKK